MDRHIASNAVEDARKFLIENPTEKKVTAARIYNLNYDTFKSSLRRESGRKRGGHNKVLNEQETEAIHQRINSLLMHGILPTHEVIFTFVVNLKRARDCKSPTRRWFRDWWKSNHLHKIKIKPLPMIRFEAADEKDVAN